MTALPAGAQPFHAFTRFLRANGFPVVAGQTIAFLEGMTRLGPRTLLDVYWAAKATLAPSPGRADEFDALFDAFFRDGGGTGAIAESTVEEDAPAKESSSGSLAPVEAAMANESGEAANAAEALAVKRFDPAADDARLTVMRRRIATAMPERRGFRRSDHRQGDKLDFRRSLAGLLHEDARAAAPVWTRRRRKLRRVLLLIDISGSMKSHTGDSLRFAHALTQSLTAVETFVFGTRLTRLTKSLRHKDIGRALDEVAPAVADWSGGTRIGENLARFLAIPRFSRASRGALVVVLSDGLERGDPGPMVAAVRRLAARSWRLAWLTPLAGDPAFSPDTAALRAILPIIDHLGDGSGIAALCRFVENSRALGGRAPAEGRNGGGRNAIAGHRRPSPHLAAGGRALARRSDGAADLRAL